MVRPCRRPGARFAGIRTFTMLGAVGGLCGWLWKTGLTAPAAILLAGAVTITAAAYVVASHQNVDATTEIAALVVLTAGLLGGTGGFRLASGIIALDHHVDCAGILATNTSMRGVEMKHVRDEQTRDPAERFCLRGSRSHQLAIA